ncbi:MAG: hypothetical protein N2654_04015, partial [Deltaproteobacteria bacterium]|nr:hypothetical protein [Deltaproteobacteria bacterium]
MGNFNPTLAQRTPRNSSREEASRFLAQGNQELNLNESQMKALMEFERKFLDGTMQIDKTVGSFLKDVGLTQVALAEGIFRGLGAAFGLCKTAAQVISETYEAMQTDFSKIRQILHEIKRSKVVTENDIKNLSEHFVNFFGKMITLAEELQNYDLKGANLAKKIFEFATDFLSVALLPVSGIGTALAKGAQLTLKGLQTAVTQGLGRFLTKEAVSKATLCVFANSALIGLFGVINESQVANLVAKLT